MAEVIRERADEFRRRHPHATTPKAVIAAMLSDIRSRRRVFMPTKPEHSAPSFYHDEMAKPYEPPEPPAKPMQPGPVSEDINAEMQLTAFDDSEASAADLFGGAA